MALYQSKSKALQSQVKQYVTLVIKNPEKSKDPINIVNGIHNIKGRTTVNVLVLNYSNRHVMFSNGEYIGHLENINLEEENSQLYENPDAYTTSSVTTKRMM